MTLKYIIFDPHAPRRFWRFFVYLYILGILFFSIQPDLRPPDSGNAVVEQVKNWLHVPAYAGLTFLLLCGLGRLSWRTRLAAFAVAVGYGSLNEWFQSFIPGRSCSWDDVARNTFGALLVVLFVRHNPIRLSLAFLGRFGRK